MKTRFWIFAIALLAASCQKEAPPVAETKPEVPVQSETRWSKLTELFVEYPKLIMGQPSRFAIHLTRLDNFRAVRNGTVEVRLQRPGSPEAVFRVESPSRPGIFGVTVTPTAAGEYDLAIHLKGEGLEDTHSLGKVRVEATAGPMGAEEEAEDPNAVSFLKEQQWTLDFATALATEQSLHEGLRVPAEVTARAGGDAEVDAPFDGRVVLMRIPPIGSPVQAGQVLAQLVLPTSTPSDPAALELAQAEALAQLQYARRDRERAERLVSSGAAPAKRLDEARRSELTAEARMKAAEARLAQFESSRLAEPGASPTRQFAIRAPIHGILQEVGTSSGSQVKAGDALFRIVDLDTVYVSAIVPESEFPQMRNLSGAELEIPGLAQAQALRQLVTVGRVVDAASRTFPVIYAFDNRSRWIAINQTVYVRIRFASGPRLATVPESALVDDGGSPIVFVQASGESFLRRAVKTGLREGGLVQILEGLKPGERVVTKGAALIRLASLSSQVPVHGHVH